MALRHSTGLKTYILNSGFGSAFDTNGVIKVYTGTQPANADAAPTGTLLGTLSMSADAFATAANGTITINAVNSDVSADATGTAGWFRMQLATDSAGVSTTDRRLDGTLGTSGTDLTIDNASITLGGTIAMSSFTYNHAP